MISNIYSGGPIRRLNTSFRSTCIPRIRNYGTRSHFDSPFDHLPKRGPKPWISWRSTTFFFITGAALAYNETLFEFYAKVTDTSEDDDLLPMRLTYELKNLPIYERLAHPKPNEKWVQLKSWENLDRNILENQEYKTKKEEEYGRKSLTTTTLAQKGGFAIEPVIFHNTDTNEGVTILHVGYRLCGYPFLVHGGILATILNETFKRNASLSSSTTSTVKGDFKVENLSISYKYPSFANQFLIIKTKPVLGEGDGNKQISLESVIESQKGNTLVKSQAVLIDTGRELKRLNEGNKSWWKF